MVYPNSEKKLHITVVFNKSITMMYCMPQKHPTCRRSHDFCRIATIDGQKDRQTEGQTDRQTDGHDRFLESVVETLSNDICHSLF